jgi:hypothetical protein
MPIIRRIAPFKVRFPLPILRRRVIELCTKFVREFGQPQSKAAWIEAEKLAGEIMNGCAMPSSHPYDYKVSVSGKCHRIEVKYSTCSKEAKWSFNKIFGESGQRDFDILLMIGLADKRFVKLYHPDAELTGLVFFAIPISKVSQYCNQSGRSQIIDMPTYPGNRRRKAAPLYRYQIGAVELWRGRVFACPPYDGRRDPARAPRPGRII